MDFSLLSLILIFFNFMKLKIVRIIKRKALAKKKGAKDPNSMVKLPGDTISTPVTVWFGVKFSINASTVAVVANQNCHGDSFLSVLLDER